MPVPTIHKRIAVLADPELMAALERVRPLFPGRPLSSIVHDLAVRGADQVAASHEGRARAIATLKAFSAAPADYVDLDVIRDVRDRAWR